MGKALLVVDVQEGVYAFDGQAAFDGPEMIAVINRLIARARESGATVIFVRHEDEYLAHGSDSWEVVPDLDVQAGDLFVNKRHGSAFHETPLREHLRSLGIQEIVLCGMQTEYCIDSTFRHALTLGYKVELVRDGHTTFDSPVLTARQIVDHHNQVFSGYARVRPAEAIRFTSEED